MAVDIASIRLELDSGPMLSGVERIEAALRRLEQSVDRTSGATSRGSRASKQGADSMGQQAKEALQLAIAQARVQRSMADYTGAIETLRGAMKNVSATSVEYLRIQNQIVQIQNQARRASVGANFEGFAKSLQDIQGQMRGFGGAFGNAVGRIQNVGTALGEVSGLSAAAIGAISGVAIALAAVGVAAGTVGKALVDAAIEGGRIADSFKTLSDITGVSVASIEKLEVGYTLFGGHVEDARQAITKFAAGLGEAATGEAPQLEKALKALGVEPVTAVRNIDAALKQTLQALAKTENQAAATALATRLFGREGARMVAVYREMADENSELNKEIEQFGLIVGGTALNNAARIGTQLGKMEVQFRAVKLVIADQLAPALVDLGQSFAGLVAAALPAIKAVAGAFDGLIDKVSFLLNLLSRSPAAFGKIPTGLPGNLIPGATNRFGQPLIEAPANKATTFTETTDAIANIRKLQEGLKQPSLQQKGLTTSDPVVDALKLALAGNDRRTGGSRGSAGAEKIDQTTQRLLYFVEAVDKLGRQSLPQTVDTLIDADRDIDRLAATLTILSKAGYDTTNVMKELAKAQVTLGVSQKRFFELTGTALTEQISKIPLAVQAAGVPGGLASGNIPGVGGTMQEIARFLRDAIRREFISGSGGQRFFGGPIPGQGDPGQAPDPRNFRLQGLGQQFFGRTAGTGERIQGVGELIAQDFITGALLGQADARRAGEQVAFFFADYFARKMTEVFSKALDPAFDALAGLIGSLFKKIVGKVGGGLGGILGGLFGGAFAGGGTLQPRKFGIAGERGPELIFSGSNALQVVPMQQFAAGGGGGGMNVSMTFNISAPNGQVDRRSMDQISEGAMFAISRAQRNRGA